MREEFYINCPICGIGNNIFENNESICKNCSISKQSTCELIRCKNCSYEFIPSDPKLIQFLKKIRKIK